MIDREGILLVNKEKKRTAFYLIKVLRHLLKIKKIGHAGILDPFATGVMVMLIGRPYTKISNQLINQDKEYLATIKLGVATTTYDCDGNPTSFSEIIPKEHEIKKTLSTFQGKITQIPPMFSAKKINGQKLYALARKGIEIKRKPISVQLDIELIDYFYPHLKLHIQCSKGTYIRSLANDIGEKLGSKAHLLELTRIRSGPYHLKDCIDAKRLHDPSLNLISYIRKKP